MKKTIGIIGGMGPLATADLFRKIILHTRANSDQEHLRVLIDNNTSIPDRTAAILHGGPSPLPKLTESAELLCNAGADFLIMPCNTAHYYYDALAGSVRVPVLHMIRLTAEAVRASGCRRAGLLATDGTISTGIYDEAFTNAGVALQLPDADGQNAIMSLVYDDIKGGNPKISVERIREILDGMRKNGAECFVLGCTEMPIAFERYALSYPAVDATDVLAGSAVTFAGGELI